MPADPPELLVVGDRVALGPLRRDLAGTYGRWVNQHEVREGLLNLGIDTPETAGAWVDEQVKKGVFERRTLELGAPRHPALAVGDVNGDHKADFVVGNMAAAGPVEAWVELWIRK